MSSPAAMPSVLAVVVNFNTGDLLQGCMRALLAQDYPVSLVVVDNASTDGSGEQAAAAFAADQRVSVICGRDNPGFATAVNRTVGRAGSCAADYLLILNPDCELHPGALRRLVSELERHPGAALAGPLLVDPAGRPQRANARRFPDPWKSFVTFSGLWRLGARWPLFRGVEWTGPLPRESREVEAVSGACMLVRCDAFLGVGGMDTAYALHCEDLDLMYRLRQCGGACLFVPGSRATHVQGVSSGSRPLWSHWQRHRGMQRFFQKFQATGHAWPVRGLVTVGIWLRWLATLPRVWLR